jgi:hypothetical protein
MSLQKDSMKLKSFQRILDEAGELPKRFNAVKEFPNRSDAIDELPKGFHAA